MKTLNFKLKTKQQIQNNKVSVLKWIHNYKIKNKFKYDFPHTLLYYYNLENNCNLSLKVMNGIIDEHDKELNKYQEEIIKSLPFDINKIQFKNI